VGRAKQQMADGTMKHWNRFTQLSVLNSGYKEKESIRAHLVKKWYFHYESWSMRGML
jgi:hypothetical protein